VEEAPARLRELVDWGSMAFFTRLSLQPRPGAGLGREDRSMSGRTHLALGSEFQSGLAVDDIRIEAGRRPRDRL